MITSAKALLKVVPALFCLAFSIESFAAEIQLAWDPNPETNLAGYKVYYGLAPGNYSLAINLGNQTTYTVTGLAVGTYYFVVTAYDTSGLESDASNQVSATIGVSATLSLVATPGSGNVTVSWSGVNNATVTDWIGRYSTGAGDGSYGEWKYSSSCAESPGSSPRSSGSCVFVLPAVAGTYEYRLFANGSYVRLGTSNIITISAGGAGPELTANPNSVTPGGAVTLSWNGVANATVTDWIGRFAPGAANASYGDWKYTSTCAQSSGGAPRSSGSCSFTMPLTTDPSEFRLFASGSYTRLATSSTVTTGGGGTPTLTAGPGAVGPGGTVTLVWNGVSGATAADWIGCYFTAGESTQGWMYTSSCSQSAGASGALSGSCIFTMPGTPGTYEFRLFANNGFTLVAKSGVVEVN
jgi:fibronectin type 3 domain-containing protein